MRIGELAARAGVTRSAIRFYEARGLLAPPARTGAGYREYGDRDLEVLAFVTRAQGLGFTLRDIGRHLASPEGPGRKARVRARLEAKLAELDAHLADVHRRRDMVAQLLAELDDGGGDPAPRGRASAAAASHTGPRRRSP